MENVSSILQISQLSSTALPDTQRMLSSQMMEEIMPTPWLAELSSAPQVSVHSSDMFPPIDLDVSSQNRGDVMPMPPVAQSSSTLSDLEILIDIDDVFHPHDFETLPRDLNLPIFDSASRFEDLDQRNATTQSDIRAQPHPASEQDLAIAIRKPRWLYPFECNRWAYFV